VWLWVGFVGIAAGDGFIGDSFQRPSEVYSTKGTPE